MNPDDRGDGSTVMEQERDERRDPQLEADAIRFGCHPLCRCWSCIADEANP